MLQGTYHFSAQERIWYGTPYARALANELEAAQAARVFVTTTRSLAKGRLIEGVIATLGERFAGAFQGIAAHSPREAVIAGAQAISAANADLVVAVGGGSVIDATKVMLIALQHGATSVEALDALVRKPPDASAWSAEPLRLRMVALPTTLSAAEFTHFAGVTDTARGVKSIHGHALAVPKAVILDPTATLETPLELMLSTGMRALDHAVEHWCANVRMPLADALAHEAMHLLARGLPAIRREADALAPRLDCQMAGWLAQLGGGAGIPYGASHGLGYILGAYLGVPHGVTSCLTLPAVMTWNAPANAPRQQAVSEAFGAPGAPAGAVLRRFVESLGLPARLGDAGIGRDQISAIAARYDGTGPIATNPRPVRGPDDLAEILSLAL